jgi:catechol 2,3-dioxygenase-like lactoylglutathione lyase family enzyme
MFDHVEYHVSDYKAARHFYRSCLEPISWRLIKEDLDSRVLGFSPDRFIRLHLTATVAVRPLVHVAFKAVSRSSVDAFYTAGLDAGGVDNGEPGSRDYGTPYYAAFLLDPDGHNIEAVFRSEE